MADTAQDRIAAQAHAQLDIATYDYDTVISSVVGHFTVALSETLLWPYFEDHISPVKL